MNTVKRILIVRTDRLGDVILSTPVIEELRARFPRAHIAFMCRPYTRAVLEGNPYLDEVIVYDKYGVHKSLWGTLKFIVTLRQKSFDLALILHPTNRAHWITFLSGIRQRVGWNSKKGWLLTKHRENNKHQGMVHERDYTLRLLELIGGPAACRALYVPVREEASGRVREVLEKKGIDSRNRLILINPSASCPSKRWPVKHFLSLIDSLRSDDGFTLAVIGAPGEEIFSEPLIAGGGTVDLRGLFDLSELIALIKRADLLISNDSGPVHIAAALNVAVISIFGRADKGLSPDRWRPLGKNSFYFHRDVGCPVCRAHNCEKGFLCLEAVEPEEVVRLARDILGRGAL